MLGQERGASIKPQNCAVKTSAKTSVKPTASKTANLTDSSVHGKNADKRQQEAQLRTIKPQPKKLPTVSQAPPTVSSRPKTRSRSKDMATGDASSASSKPIIGVP